MEFREIINLIKKHSLVFWLFLGMFFGIGMVFYNQQNQLYSTSMAVHISRENQNENDKYNQFYRLQADEKFGKNIVNWVKDPGFISIIKRDFEETGDQNWSDISGIKIAQLSANYIRINFESDQVSSAVLLGQVLKDNLILQNKKLKADQENNWFRLVVDKVRVERKNPNFFLILGASVFLGVFFGIIGVLLRYYFKAN